MKAKVITTFRDKHDKSIVYKAGKVYDFTEERFAEILETGKYVERVEAEPPAEEPAAEAKKKTAKKKKSDE